MKKIEIDHITRVEGHGNLKVEVNKEKVKARFEVYESPRFFEAIVKGRRCEEVIIITSRICGICASSHALAAVKAVEAALRIKPSPQTVLLRKILLAGETIQSHVLHIYFLALPDFLGAPSVFSIAQKNPQAVKRAVMLKKLGNDICRVVGGRSVHPISVVAGGFSQLPTEEELADLREQLAGARIGAEATVELFRLIKMPDFSEEREFISIASNKEFALYDGKITSSYGWQEDTDNYKKKITEKVMSHSTAKHSTVNNQSFMVGALARVNNNSQKLSQNAKKAMEALGISIPNNNAFNNNAAQIVELVHLIDDTIELIDKVLTKGITDERPGFKVKEGHGVGVVEAPRGTLYHEYWFDKKGRVRKGNVITPTAQNALRIEKDVEAFVPTVLKQPKDKVKLQIEELVRAYDPCISCSAHLIGL